MHDVLNARWSQTSLRDAEKLVFEIFGLTGRASTLSSERDETFFFRANHGDRFILKIANPAESRDVLDFQSRALLHLEHSAPDLPVPRLIPPFGGGHDYDMPGPEGTIRNVRLLSYLDGEQLHKARSSLAQARNMGNVLARLGQSLASYHPAVPDNRLLWDITHTLDLRNFVAFLDESRRGLVTEVLDRFQTAVVPLQANLPTQVIHNDFNPYNILVDSSDNDRVTGIIDFGDMVQAARINDVAVALAYHVGKPDGFAMVGAFLDGYQHITPLTQLELGALGDLIMARLAMTIIITEWRASERPENRDYILRNHPASLAGLQKLAPFAGDDLLSILNSAN